MSENQMDKNRADTNGRDERFGHGGFGVGRHRRGRATGARTIAVLATVSVGILVLAACGGGDDASTEQAPAETAPAETAPAEPAASDTAPAETAAATDAATGEPLQIAFFAPLANSYVNATIDGINEVVGQENAEVTTFDTGFDAQKEFSQMQDAVALGKFDAFIVIPLDPVALVPVAEDAIKAGISVVNTDLALGPDLTTFEPQVDGQAGTVMTPGTIRAENITQLLIDACASIDPCNVGWIAGVATIDFETKIKERLDQIVEEYPNIKLVAYQDGGGYLTDPAIPIAQNILQAHSDLSVLATSGDQMTLGAELAVKDAGKEGEVQLIGGGGSCPGVQAVEEGRWFGTTLDVPRNEGVLGAQIAIAHGRGEQTEPVGVNAQAESGYPSILTKETLASSNFECQWEG